MIHVSQRGTNAKGTGKGDRVEAGIPLQLRAGRQRAWGTLARNPASRTPVAARVQNHDLVTNLFLRLISLICPHFSLPHAFALSNSDALFRMTTVFESWAARAFLKLAHTFVTRATRYCLANK